MEPISASTVLSTIGSVITTGYQIYTYLSAVKNASKAAKALETEIATLDVALEKIRRFLEKHNVEGKETAYDSTSVLFRSVNGCKEELKALSEQLGHFRSPHRLSRVFHQLTWPLGEQDTVKAAEALHRYAQIFQLSLSTDSYAFLSESCDKALGKLAELQSSNTAITTDLAAVRHLLIALGNGLVDQKFKEFVEWIPTIPYQDKHHFIQTQRLEGSGKWLLDSGAFRAWQDFTTSNSTLFCQGGPGVGKSFMSCIVTDYLFDVARQTKAYVTYFYFDYKSQETQRPFSVVSCLLRQVLSQYAARPKQVDALWELFDRKQGLPSWQLLVDKFCQLCSETPVYVVLDALDECDATENRGPILGFIEEMRRRNARLFATSRPFPQDVLDAFEGAVPVDIEASNTDLRRYLLDTIGKSKKNKNIMTKELRERIVAKIVENSQGMFLLATFQINYVLAQNSRGEMDESLKVLPKGLWANFDMTLTRIDNLPYEHQARFAKQTLLWITTAARPLKVDEIRHAMRIAEAPHDFKLSTIPAGQLFVEYCFGFVVIDSRSDTVQLAHFSIYEYLRQRQFEFITCGNRTVSLACVNYMLLPWLPGTSRDLVDNDDLDGIAEEDSEALLDDHYASKLSFWSSLRQSGDKVPTAATFDVLLERLPFMDYAASYWGDHASKDFSGSVSDTVNRWLQNDESFVFWGWMNERNAQKSLYNKNSSELFVNRHKDEQQNLGRCHVAARYGLWELMPQDALELRDVINSTTANGDTPLMIAAERGHVGFVKSLLAHAAIKINEVDVDENTALCRAVNAGQMVTIQSLFGAADINVTLGTPLHIALDLGHASIIDSLLDRNDLDINAFRDDAALRHILYSDLNLGLLKKMLKRPDILPRFFRPPYHMLENTMAILSEDTDIMTEQELHDFPLIIKTLAEDFWTRGQRDKRDRYLSWVWSWLAGTDGVLGSHFKFYLEWLDEGLDRRMADEFNDTILHDAARRPSGVDRLEQLLKHGFDVDLRSADGRTALQIAATTDSAAGVELLLASGADVNARDNDGWTALHYAATASRADMVDALLLSGADKNSQTKTGFSAMQRAAQNGQAAVVRRLFERGADFASRTNENKSLLFTAVDSGNIETVKLALDINGPDGINSFTPNGVSPLIVACLMNKPDLVKTLVENGADVSASDPEGYTALHAAAAKDSKEIVGFLLGRGADPNAQAIYFGTPYTMAVENMAEVRKELLAHGGDISVDGAYGRTPVTFFDSIGVLEEELQGVSGRPLPASPAETRQRQIRRVKAILRDALGAHSTNQTQPWHFTLIGHLLGFLGNTIDARIAFEQNVSWDNNYVTNAGLSRCQACLSESTTGSLFICTCCTRAMFCPACFSQHAAFHRVIFEQFSADDVFASGGRDRRWAAFLEINGLMDIRYKFYGGRKHRDGDQHDVITPEGRQELILSQLREKMEPEDSQERISVKFPYCDKEHIFVCVPGWEWLELTGGTVNTQGQTLGDWLQTVYNRYD